MRVARSLTRAHVCIGAAAPCAQLVRRERECEIIDRKLVKQVVEIFVEMFAEIFGEIFGLFFCCWI